MLAARATAAFGRHAASEVLPLVAAPLMRTEAGIQEGGESMTNELVFEIVQEADGGFTA